VTLALDASTIVDGIIVLVIVELLVLGAYQRVWRRGMPLPELFSFLGAGLGLLVAVRILIANGSLVLFAGMLLLSGLFHLWHVRQRWI
jgi:hypothetical protein